MIPGISRVELLCFFGECEWFGRISFCGVNLFLVWHVQFDIALCRICARSAALGGCSSGLWEMGCIWGLTCDYLCLVIPASDGPVSRTPDLTLVITGGSRFPRAPADLGHTSAAGHSLFPWKVLQFVKDPLLEAGREAGWAASLVGCRFKGSFTPSFTKWVLVLQFFPWVLILHQKPTAFLCQCVLIGDAFLFLEIVRACEESVLMQRDVVWILIQDGETVSRRASNYSGQRSAVLSIPSKTLLLLDDAS